MLQVSALEDAGRLEEAEALARASVKEQLGDALRRMAGGDPLPPGGHALIIDGKALTHALGDYAKDSLLAVRTAHCSVKALLGCSHELPFRRIVQVPVGSILTDARDREH